MRDEIFWGNLIGLLKRGTWTLSYQESQALVAVVMEAEKRSRPLPIIVEEKPEPIVKKGKK